MVRLLHALGVDLNAVVERHGCTPAHIAVEKGQLGMVRLLHELGAEINNDADGRGSTPAAIASGNGDLEAVSLLQALGVDLNGFVGSKRLQLPGSLFDELPFALC